MPSASAWPTDPDALVVEQRRLAALVPPPWAPPARPLRVAGCFVAFERGAAGPGAPGDPAWTGAVVWDEATGEVLAASVVHGRAGARYEPGLLALREGPMLLEALERLGGEPDVVLVDGTGRDHPRRCGVAVHLGALLDRPTVGITHRPLVADRVEPPLARRGERSALHHEGEEVGAWVCTQDGVRPLVAHAGWRTSTATAVDVALRSAPAVRTPEPLRLARAVARSRRSQADGSAPSP